MQIRRSIQRRLATLMAMMADGNNRYQGMLDRLKEDHSSYARSRRGNTHTCIRKNSPGRKRKGQGHYMTPRKPNPERRARKTLNGEIKHMSNPRGASLPRGPSRKAVQALEKRLSLKMNVRGAKCFLRFTKIEIPINMTLIEFKEFMTIPSAA